MKKKEYLWHCLLLSLVLSACRNDAALNAVTEPSGNIAISTEDTSVGLSGIDANANHIRDDIDKIISEQFSATPEIKQAAEQAARAIQQLMEASTDTAALTASELSGRATVCLAQRLPGETNYHQRIAIGRTIEALTANTPERLRQYLHVNRLLSGTTWKLPQATAQVCDE